MPYRALADERGPGLPEEQMRAYAAQFTVDDLATGESRPATPTDYFPPRAIENAPDLSLMAKARAGFHGPVGTGINQIVNGMGGPEYIASILTGFTGEEEEEAGVMLYENTRLRRLHGDEPGAAGRRRHLSDGTAATPEQMAQDVAAFLMWAAEPKMMVRKQAGMTAVLFLALLAVLLYFTNKKLWAPIKGKNHA